jgi:hypothetical protein
MFQCSVMSVTFIVFTSLNMYLHLVIVNAKYIYIYIYKPEGRGFDTRLGDFFFFFLIYLILQAALGPGVYSACNRNEYQKHKNNNVSGE